MVPSEETSDARPRDGDLARGGPDQDVGADESEHEECDAPEAFATSSEADRRPRDGDLACAGGHEDAGDEADQPAGGVGPGLRCARCRRAGIEEIANTDDGTRSRRVRPRRRPRRALWAMTSATEPAKSCPIAAIGTALGRARCPQPARIERMKQSLATHGQLTPLVAAARPEGMELVDGFKRRAAAEALGWPTLLVATRPLDATGQWAAMLLLNRGPTSMSTLEEALVLREMVVTGLSQTEIAALCARHKAWVNRRIGLVDRLHPELMEAMKLGLLPPGSARRLLSLPPGNQLEVAAAVQKAGLGPRDTELLVGLWRRTSEPKARRALLLEPRSSLSKHHPETRRSPLDPRLGPEGQRLCRCLHRFEAAARETSRRLESTLATTDRAILDEALRTSAGAASRLATELGSARTGGGERESGKRGETS